MFNRFTAKWLALIGGMTLTASVALAQDSGPLIDVLVKKGILTDQEAEDVRADLVKDFANVPAGKLNISTGLTELKISGDVRIRYEYRQGQNLTGDNLERGRFRYRVRPTVTGKLGSKWFFGFRLENSTNSRSSNVTMGDDAGPFAKNNDAVNIGQVYLGYAPSIEWTFYAGRMPNPFVTTLMTWDADINPEGFAEQYKTIVGNVTYFGNLGQFLYSSANPQNTIGSTPNSQDQYLLGWQAGATIKTNETDFLQVAPVVYNYVNNKRTSTTFNKNFSPSNLTAINNIFVLDVPVEYDFNLAATPSRAFADVAYNFDGKKRAKKFGRQDLDSQVYAYQVGFQYGKPKLKGEWDAKVFYQQTDLFALDANLVDSDIFDSRVNMKGVVFGADYLLTDAVTFSLTYANGRASNKSAVSAGSGDIGITTLNKYNLLQVDFVAKF